MNHPLNFFRKKQDLESFNRNNADELINCTEQALEPLQDYEPFLQSSESKSTTLSVYFRSIYLPKY